MSSPVTPDGMTLLVNVLGDISRLHQAASKADGIVSEVLVSVSGQTVEVIFEAKIDLGLRVESVEPAV